MNLTKRINTRGLISLRYHILEIDLLPYSSRKHPAPPSLKIPPEEASDPGSGSDSGSGSGSSGSGSGSGLFPAPAPAPVGQRNAKTG